MRLRGGFEMQAPSPVPDERKGVGVGGRCRRSESEEEVNSLLVGKGVW